MAKDLNKVMLSGRLGKDPEIKYLQSGMAITTFSVASGRRVKEGDGFKDQTEWFRVVAWDKLAETCSQYLRKGSHVMIEGRLQTREYQDQQGQKRYSTEVIANDMYMMDGKRQDGAEGDDWSNNAGSGNSNGNQRPASNSRPSRSTNEYSDEMEPEDIPF